MNGDMKKPTRPARAAATPQQAPNRRMDGVIARPKIGREMPHRLQPAEEAPADLQTDPVDTASPLVDADQRPKKRSIKKRITVAVTALLVIAAFMVAGAFALYYQGLSAVDAGSNEKVKITIAPGTGPAAIAAQLKKSGVIRSETAFSWYVRLEGKAGLLQSGVYRLSKSDDVPTIVKHLTSGTTDTFSITFLPGATLAKHRQVLIDAGYPAGQVDEALKKNYQGSLFEGKPTTADLEGYIYGETYNFPADATPEQILQRTFDQFETVVKQENLAELYKQRGFTLYQGITLASIIQREVATPGDAAQVAQVFELRLKMGMQLGSDVTYQYIADKTGQERRVDLDSPYNTRRYTGLPPGPISSPGLAALKAVGNPAPGDYVYFLSGDDDKTYFARTNEEHERNIRDHCQKKCQII